MIEFKHKILIGKPCVVSDYFAEHFLLLMCNKAEQLGLIIKVNSSFRQTDNVPGAIVKPAKMSNHMIGHAIDVNFIDGKIFWSSEMLNNPKGKVLELINYCKSIGMRWGGEFAVKDTVHFDDGLNVNHPDLWVSAYNQIHNIA